jgi:hypothetical protein
VYDQANGAELTAEQKARLKEIQSQRRAEIAGTLSPSELSEYDLRTSSTAQELRYNMGAFNGKEDDFRNVFKLTKAYEDKIAQAEANGTLTPELKASAKAEMEQALKDSLGDRYADYQRSQDASYRDLYQAGQRNNLPTETVQKVYDMKRVAEEQRQLLLNTDNLTEEQKEAGFAALRAETERAIKDTLGEKAFKDYQRRGGEWLLNLGVPKENK